MHFNLNIIFLIFYVGILELLMGCLELLMNTFN